MPEVDTLKVPKVYVNTECKLGAHAEGSKETENNGTTHQGRLIFW